MRAKKIGLPIILATSKNKFDNHLVNYVKNKYDIIIFRGKEQNVLGRWHDCFKKFKIKYACMVDGDDLSFDFNLYRSGLKKIKNKYEVITKPEKIITGLFTYVLSDNSIQKAYRTFSKKKIGMMDSVFKKIDLKKRELKIPFEFKKKNIRLTLDYIEDYNFFYVLYNFLHPCTSSIKIVNFLKKNKDICKLNYFREAFWKRNQRVQGKMQSY